MKISLVIKRISQIFIAASAKHFQEIKQIKMIVIIIVINIININKTRMFNKSFY
jgi:hypothetical protein